MARNHHVATGAATPKLLRTASGLRATQIAIDSTSPTPFLADVNHANARPENSTPLASVTKRAWTTPEIKPLKVAQTELGFGYYGEMVGLNGCSTYKANASTNVCVAAT